MGAKRDPERVVRIPLSDLIDPTGNCDREAGPYIEGPLDELFTEEELAEMDAERTTKQ